jgi:hypothetical protein
MPELPKESADRLRWSVQRTGNGLIESRGSRREGSLVLVILLRCRLEE